MVSLVPSLILLSSQQSGATIIVLLSLLLTIIILVPGLLNSNILQLTPWHPFYPDCFCILAKRQGGGLRRRGT